MGDSLSVVLKRKRDQEDRLRRSDPAKNLIIGEDGAGGQTITDPGAALTVAVESLNGLIGDVTIVAGDNVTITPSGQTLIIEAIVPEVQYFEPITNGDPSAPELLFDDDGDIIMAEVV